MTILLKDTARLRWQTDLSRLLPPIRQQVESLNWLITELQCWHIDGEWPAVIPDWEEANPYAAADGRTLYETFAGRDLQVVWGVFCGVQGNVPTITDSEIPFADGNRKLWTEPETFLLAASELEIICFDSTLTFVKFRDEELGNQFLHEFPGEQIMGDFHSERC